MCSSAVFILDLKGKPIISRNYRGDVDMNAIDKFLPSLMEKEEEGLLTPILHHSDTTFVYLKYNNIFRMKSFHYSFLPNFTHISKTLFLVVSMSKKNVNVSLILSFLYKCCEVFTEYFKELEEESIRDNFVITYELLDEMMDFGFPQTTDYKILQEYITQEGHKLEIAPRPPMAVTNAVSWRSDGVKYRKNEVFLDVIESVNLLANSKGVVLRSEIVGSIKMR
uniref:MHD domain-containing protein n=1 Tax=Romanomermis culicivorax TaxID=13658 RepID=A0A915JVS3_ROMCU